MNEIILAAIIVFIASTLQAAIGFGFAIFATPLLLLVFNSRDVIQISIILSLVNALILMPKIKHDIIHPFLKRLILGSSLGVLIGLFFYTYASINLIKITISIIILTVTFYLIFKQHLIAGVEDLPTKSLPANNNVSKSGFYKLPLKVWELLVGLCAGILTTGIGMPGVPLVIYYNAQNTPKAAVRGTTIAFFIAVYIISIIMQLFTVKISANAMRMSIFLFPASIMGVYLGDVFFAKINQKMFQLIANMILIATGLYMLIKSMMDLNIQ